MAAVQQPPAFDVLAEQISRHAAILQQQAAASSAVASGLAALNSDAPNAAYAQTRAALAENCRQLLRNITEPADYLKSMVLVEKHNLVSLQIINHFRIAEHVPATGTIGYTDLAIKCGLPPDNLIRIIRQSITNGIFAEPVCGQVAHTTISREIPGLAPLLSYQLEICLPSSTQLLSAWKLAMQDQKQAAKNPFQLAHGTDDTWWVYAEKSSFWTQIYGKYQGLITSGGAHDVSFVVSGFEWAKLGPATIVDVGGADAFVANAVATAFPELKVIVQDSVNLEAAANANIPSSLKSRVRYVPHSFFEPQPESSRSVDAFFLRHIFHDWDDEACFKIIRHLTAVMKPGAKLLVAEQLLPQLGEVASHTERTMRALDMQMMVQFGGKERTYDDWVKLFETADPRLHISRLSTLPSSADSFMEVCLS